MKPTHFSITLFCCSTLYSSNFYAQEWAISPFNYQRDYRGQSKLHDIDPALGSYISSLLPVTALYTLAPTETLVIRNKSNGLEGYTASVIIRGAGLIEIFVKNDYAQCYTLLARTLESLQKRGASEARLFFNVDDDPNLKEKYGYEAFRMLGFISEFYTEDQQRVVLRKKLK